MSLSPKQTILKKRETRFCRQKTAEDNNAKINVNAMSIVLLL